MAKKSKKKTEAQVGKGTLSQEDLLIVQLRVQEKQNAQLRVSLLTLQHEKAIADQEAKERGLRQVMQSVNEKYELIPGEDAFDLNTGEIKRGE